MSNPEDIYCRAEVINIVKKLEESVDNEIHNQLRSLDTTYNEIAYINEENNPTILGLFEQYKQYTLIKLDAFNCVKNEITRYLDMLKVKEI